MMEKLWVDFNSMGKEGVRLTCVGTQRQIAEKNIALSNGLKLIVYMEDKDENDDDMYIYAEATVKLSKTDQCWVGQINDSDYRYESKLP